MTGHELGIGEDTGLIREGYAADLILVKGDVAAQPDSIRTPVLILKTGIAYDPARLIADVQGQIGLR